jgi:hypothetical protein
MAPLFDPAVIFFLLVALAGVAKFGLRLPQYFYHTRSIYLLPITRIKASFKVFNTLFTV